VGIGLGLAVGILLRRLLGPEGIGQFEVFRSTAVLAATIPPLGLGSASTYFLNSGRASHVDVLSGMMKFTIVVGILLAIVLTVIIDQSPRFFAVSRPITVLFALGVAALMGRSLLKWVLTADLAVGRMVSLDLSQQVVLLVGGGMLMLWGAISAQLAIILLSMAHFASFFLALYFLRGHMDFRRRVNWRMLWSIWGYGVKLAAANILVVLTSSLTVLLLNHLTPDDFSEVGLYTSAVRVMGLGTLVPMAIGPLLYSKWSGEPAERRARQAEMAARLNFVYGLVAALGIFFLGGFILRILYGIEYVGGAAALDYLAPALLFAAQLSVFNNLLASDGKAMITAWVLFGTLIVVCTLTFLLVPSLGIRGTAIAVLCGNAFNAIACGYVCHRLYGLSLVRCLVPRWSDVRYVHEAMMPGRRAPSAVAG